MAGPPSKERSFFSGNQPYIDDEFEIIPYNERYEEQLKVVLRKYYDNENFAIALKLNLPGNDEACETLIQYSIDAAEDGISLLAREIANRYNCWFSNEQDSGETEPSRRENIFRKFQRFLDEFEIIPYNVRYKEQLKAVLRKYYDTENFAIGLELNLPGNDEAREALIQYSIDAAEDGISLLAREKSTDTIVGSVTNKIQVKPNRPAEKTFSEMFLEKYCKDEKSQFYVQAIIDTANKYDIFTTYKTDCYVELMFVSTLPEYRQKSIASSLCLYSVKIAEALRYGIGLEMVPEYLRSYRPTCVIAMFASNYSSAIGRKLGFDFIDKNSYEEIYYNGKKMSERIGEIHKAWYMAVKSL